MGRIGALAKQYIQYAEVGCKLIAKNLCVGHGRIIFPARMWVFRA